MLVGEKLSRIVYNEVAGMSSLREEDDPYVIEEPSDEDPAQSRSFGFGKAAADIFSFS